MPDGAQEIETRLVVWDLVRRLTPDQQEVVRLKFAGGLTTAQIALALRKSEPAVKMLLSRALHSLREDLGKEVSING